MLETVLEKYNAALRTNLGATASGQPVSGPVLLHRNKKGDGEQLAVGADQRQMHAAVDQQCLAGDL
ncbi:MAG TPA: hypothetical protein VLV55_07560, partial [Rhizomicrobium sp.]|nr:hypothetical protein [Rhizomicrobium sp.]